MVHRAEIGLILNLNVVILITRERRCDGLKGCNAIRMRVNTGALGGERRERSNVSRNAEEEANFLPQPGKSQQNSCFGAGALKSLNSAKLKRLVCFDTLRFVLFFFCLFSHSSPSSSPHQMDPIKKKSKTKEKASGAAGVCGFCDYEFLTVTERGLHRREVHAELLLEDLEGRLCPLECSGTAVIACKFARWRKHHFWGCTGFDEDQRCVWSCDTVVENRKALFDESQT